METGKCEVSLEELMYLLSGYLKKLDLLPNKSSWYMGWDRLFFAPTEEELYRRSVYYENYVSYSVLIEGFKSLVYYLLFTSTAITA